MDLHTTINLDPENKAQPDAEHMDFVRLELESNILSQINEAILAINNEGQIIYFNRGAEVIFGIEKEHAVGRHIKEIVRNRHILFEEDASIHEEIDQAGIWTGRDVFVLKDWRTRQVTLSITRLVEGGSKKGIIAVMRDILRDVTVNRQQELRIEHRLRVESALIEGSQRLVSVGKVDIEALLGIMGEALEAQSVYFVETPPDKHLTKGDGQEPEAMPRIWERTLDNEDNDPFLPLIKGQVSDEDVHRMVCKWNAKRLSRSRKGDPAALAVPVLSPQGKLHGYLGVEYGGRPPEWKDADIRVLSVLGDLLSTYFERRISEQALQESEERYRTFVDTISEAIWRIELDEHVKLDEHQDNMVAAICSHGILAECNNVMAVLLGYAEQDQILGRSLTEVMPNLEIGIIERFVNSEFRLLNAEYSFYCGQKEPRHLIINAVGTVEDGELVRIWGSCVEVTERVYLEKQMVEALEEQQQRIGRDLHDGVGQLLTGVRMLSRNIVGKLEDEHSEALQQADKVASFAEQASQRVREIYRGLTPTQLFHEGLVSALNELAHNTNMLPGVACFFESDEEVDVWDRDTKMHMYRIAQEATNNALKHAEASTIRISLRGEANEITVTVEDNGKGFDPTIRTGKSLGLNSMDYRARSIGGVLNLSSTEQAGTIVRCTIRENLVKHSLNQVDMN